MRVGGLDISVLVWAPDSDGARLRPQVFAQGHALFVEAAFGLPALERVSGGGALVGLKLCRYAPECPQRFLRASLEGKH
jgi:hypothetical protein